MIIAKYKFDKTIFENCMPVFNEDFTNYTITDNEANNIITRTIESDVLPTRMSFGDDYEELPSAQSLLEILELNTSAVEYFSAMFGGCCNLTKINCLIDIYGDTYGTLYRMFYNCSKLETLDLSNWDISKTEIDRLDELFSGCKSLKTIILNNLKPALPEDGYSGSISMDSMFADCESLESIDTTKMNCANHYYYMTGIFANCKSLKTLDLSGWDFRGITYMYGLFYGCESLESVDMSNSVFDSVSNFSMMFQGCKSLKSVNFSNCVHTPGLRSFQNLQSIDYMFDGCESLQSIDLSFFDFSYLSNMMYAFNNCKSLKTIKFPDQINLHFVAYYNNAFENCSSLEELNLNKIVKYDYDKYGYLPDDEPASCENIIAGCTSLKKVSLKQCQDIELMNEIISSLSTRPVDNPGILNLTHSPLTGVDINSAKQKNWKIHLRGSSRPMHTSTKICSKNSNITKN